jgi:hypothetical protein
MMREREVSQSPVDAETIEYPLFDVSVLICIKIKADPAEYHHTWWQDAQFNSPAASPLFSYNFRRQDDVVKLGFNVHFDEPPSAPPASSTYPVKAPRLK